MVPGDADRLRALDAFRGATVALMILVNNPGSWKHLYPPLAHADWHGCTPTDLVFPFFLFAVGNALALTLPPLLQRPAAQVALRIARRTALIFLIGLALNASPFVRWDAAGELVARSWETLRVMGVLQRIALAWGAAALLLWAGAAGVAWLGRGHAARAGAGLRAGRPSPADALADGDIALVRVALVLAAALLLGYWAACVAFAHGPDPYSLEGYFGTHLDRAWLGGAHLYRGEGVPFDPEGLASTVPAVAQVLLGYAVGRVVARTAGRGPIDDALLVRLFVAALGLLALAYAWQLAMPVNKKIWSSSFVLLTTGLAVAALALALRAIEQHEARGAWVGWLQAHGRHALFIFVLSGFVPRVLALVRWSDGVDAEGRVRWITPLPWLYRTAFEPLGSWVGDARFGSLAFAVANLALYTAIVVAFDRRGLRWRV
jgi:predicted acyltransferase